MLKRSVSARSPAPRSQRSDRGATAVEYAILLGLIAAVIIGVVVIVGHQVSCAFQSVSTQLASQNNGTSCSAGNGGGQQGEGGGKQGDGGGQGGNGGDQGGQGGQGGRGGHGG